ncbi:MAG: hypothetical protein A2W93_07660 [Bacteroidetes bacterium GWF2_43_63]|nr:MAG: hypothetical protein A2W93_07660 [Bacteroidetes bacterium GWF2_43_63]HBG69192.1 hypothetical protein [Bacteroidales bacterium]
MNLVLLNQANQEWENFVSNLTNEERKGLSELGEPIASNNLYFFAASKDTVRFDQTVNKLSKRYLFDEEIIPTVYKFYVERDLHELAFDYIKKAKEYLIESGTPISSIVQTIIDTSITSEVLESIKKSLVNIRSIKAKDLPLTTPDIVNDKVILSEFILHEIVQASKVLLDKIQGIKTIPHEDRYNDLLLATLKLRFQIWAWSIHDQARKGSSPTGKSAGETDITIEAGNITIALFEALILTGKDKTATQKHVLKSFSYAKNLDRYYMIIYFKGAITAFDTTWISYKQDVSTSAFTTTFVFDTAKDFEDLSSKFDEVNHLKVAKSVHGNNIEMYHIMINLSE